VAAQEPGWRCSTLAWASARALHFGSFEGLTFDEIAASARTH
jgi:hypothetical protein